MAHLKIGTFGESQGELAQNTNYLEDGVEGVDRARHPDRARAARARARAPAADARFSAFWAYSYLVGNPTYQLHSRIDAIFGKTQRTNE